MSILSTLFGKRMSTRDRQILALVKQAQAAIDATIGLDGYKTLTPPIQALWVELLHAHPDHTPLRIQVIVSAVAQFVGLHLWSVYGSRLPVPALVPLAQGVMILELVNQFTHLTPGGPMREFFGQLIVEQRLAQQTSMPIVLSSKGHEAEAQRMPAFTKMVALLPTDSAIASALQKDGDLP